MRGFWVVLGPIIFHARPDFLPGGILAIDLFFVLSSYLITTIALNEWQKTFAKALVVIGLSDEKPDVIREFMRKTKMDYAVATDESKVTSALVGVKGIPHVMVISPDGIVRWQGFPPMKEDTLNTAKLKQIIEASKKSGQK